MTRDIIASILEGEGVKAGAKGYQISEDREATCFVSTPGEILNVTRLTRIELGDKTVMLENAKGERHHFAYQDVFGIKIAPAAQIKERTTGFGR